MTGHDGATEAAPTGARPCQPRQFAAGRGQRRGTSGPGIETAPVFSPDGTKVAFTGGYDGNVDVFVIPASAGVPTRLTWHPAADTALGWTPDGARVLFTSTRTAYSRFAELFTIGLDGGLPHKLPLPMAAEGAYAPDGLRIAYVPLQRAFATWKRYRGGMTTPIWIATLANSRSRRCRATTRTTSVRCGSARRSTSCRNATAGPRSIRTTRA